MFIRNKKTKDSDTIKVQIVKSMRNEVGKVRQKVVRHLGTAKNPTQLELLHNLGRLVIEEIKQENNTQQNLFSPQELADMEVPKKQKPEPPRQPVDLYKCSEKARLTVGVREVGKEMLRLIGWDNILGASRKSSGNIIKELVLARIEQPESKKASVEKLARSADVQLDLNRVYQAMDYLDDDRIEKIKKQSCKYTQQVLKEPIDVLFYDTTTVYFESEKEDDLRIKGYSKDGKHRKSQVVLALLMTRDGLPIGYEVFPGNTYEGHTLIDAVNKVTVDYKVDNVTVVAVAGLLNRSNQTQLEQEEIPYVLGFRLKSTSASLQEKILDMSRYKPLREKKAIPLDYQTESKLYQEIEQEGKRIIVTYCPKRAHLDVENRKHSLEKLAKRLNNGKSQAALASGGYSRYLSFSAGGQAHIDPDKTNAAAKWDGLHAIISFGNNSFRADELLDRYQQLWQIEYGFRTNKHDLKIRPIYHWAPRRVKAHIAICYMAFCTLVHLQKRLLYSGINLSYDNIRKELGSLQRSIFKQEGSKKQHVVPSTANAICKKIYRSLGLRWISKPYPM